MAKTQRTVALMLALLFFLTSVATTAYVIWEINKEEPVATGEEISTEDGSQTTQPEGPQLKGTKLSGFEPRTTQVATLEKIDLTVGTGQEATAADTVTVHYTGALVSDGTIFESSLDTGNPATFPLSGVIKGWTDGVPGMKVGGKRRLIIPYEQAYGEAGSPPAIPARADLVFDIELLAIGEQ